MPVSKSRKPVSVWAQQLASMQQGASDAMATYNPNAYVNVPEDVYITKETCCLDLTQQQKLKVKRTFVVLEGDYANLSITDGLTIQDNETGLHICRRWVEQHIDPSTGVSFVWPEDDLTQLEAIITQINEEANTVEIKLKRNEVGDKVFNNVTVRKIMYDYSADQAGEVVDDSNAVVDDPNAAEVVDQVQDTPEQRQADEDEVRRQELLILCSSHGITDVDDSMALVDIVNILSQFRWTKADGLTTEENATLEEVGLSNTIERMPALVKKAPAMPAPKAPARPAAKAGPSPAPRAPVPAARARVASGKK